MPVLFFYNFFALYYFLQAGFYVIPEITFFSCIHLWYPKSHYM